MSTISKIVSIGYQITIEPNQNALAEDDGLVAIRCTNGKSDLQLVTKLASTDDALELILSLIKLPDAAS